MTLNARKCTGMATILRKTGVTSNSSWSLCSPARSIHAKKLRNAATYLSGSDERDEISTTRGVTSPARKRLSCNDITIDPTLTLVPELTLSLPDLNFKVVFKDYPKQQRNLSQISAKTAISKIQTKWDCIVFGTNSPREKLKSTLTLIFNN